MILGIVEATLPMTMTRMALLAGKEKKLTLNE